VHCICILQAFGSVHGDDLAYVFGLPLLHGDRGFTAEEAFLAQLLINYFANFAASG
jgi:carboxylesterase type B